MLATGFPKTVFLVVNSVCNLNCRMCDVGQHNRSGMFYQVMSPKGQPELPIDRLIELIDELKQWQPAIAVTSTEPLLYPDLYSLIDRVKRAGMIFQVTTNGLLLPEHAERLVDSGIDQLWISIDGPPVVHDFIRGKKGLSERIARGLDLFFDTRNDRTSPAVYVNYAISNHNFDCLDKTLEYFSNRDWPFDSITFSHLNFVSEEMAARHNRQNQEKYPATPSCILGIDPKAVNIECLIQEMETVNIDKRYKVAFAPKLNRETLEDFYCHHDRQISTSGCKALMNSMQILANGDVTGSTRCYPISLGNIFDQTVKEIWVGAKRKTMIKDLAQGLFPACFRCCGAF
jgi:MoaA/NifB/PqqE/SkfB family radical SAM enzyme